jgi:beta-galactosidase/beta-glucuronidase
LGIIRCYLIPTISISDISISYNFDAKFDKANININSRIENREFKNVTDSLIHADHFELKISLFSPDKVSSQNLPEYSFDLSRNKEKNILESISSTLYLPANLNLPLRVELWQGDVLDAIYLLFAEDSIILNGKEFILEGVAYIPSFENSGSLGSYEQMEKDIRIIKYTPNRFPIPII